jgi:WD40 repeat protein
LGVGGGVVLVDLSGEAPRPAKAFRESTGTVVSLAWAPTGDRLAVGSSDSGLGGAEVWDVARGEQLGRVPTASKVRALAWDPAGAWIAAATSDGELLKIATDFAEEVGQRFVAAGERADPFAASRAHSGPAVHVSLSPDGRFLISAASTRPTREDPWSGELRAWDTASREALPVERLPAVFQPARTVERALHSVAFRGDGRALLVASLDELQVWAFDP